MNHIKVSLGTNMDYYGLQLYKYNEYVAFKIEVPLILMTNEVSQLNKVPPTRLFH